MKSTELRKDIVFHLTTECDTELMVLVMLSKCLGSETEKDSEDGPAWTSSILMVSVETSAN